jgi:hypothetical protein
VLVAAGAKESGGPGEDPRMFGLPFSSRATRLTGRVWFDGGEGDGSVKELLPW